MTDYRRSEEELWDEDEVAEEDRRTNVLPMFPESAPRADSEREPSAAQPTAASEREHADAVGSVARFIAEPGGAVAPPNPIDAPKWSLNALAMIANDVAAAPEPQGDPRPAPPARPALPPSAGAAADPLPSMMLGPAMSTRGDATERVTTIPKTHPLANSIAPGGSRVTVPPARSRGPQRWHIALGALALLGVGAGAAVFSQSRGEHHALSASRNASTEQVAEARVIVEPLVETTIVMEEPPAPRPIEDDDVGPEEHAATGEEAGDRPVSAQRASLVPGPTRPRASGTERSAAPSAPSRSAEKALRVSVGAVELRERGPRAADGPPVPDRAQVIEAMNELAAELRACVGDEHGIADVTLTVRGSGAISHALVEGTFAGSEKGSCIARTLRTARLPPFAEPVLHIAYPLQL